MVSVVMVVGDHVFSDGEEVMVMMFMGSGCESGKLGSGDKSPSLVQCTCSLVGKKV